MSRGASLRCLALFLVLANCGAPGEVDAQAVTAYAQFAVGYPTVTHHTGTNTATVVVALDRGASAYFVVARQPNGLAGGAVPTPTVDEIFAGTDTSNPSHRSDVFAAARLEVTSANAESTTLIVDVPDLAIYDVFFATHTGDPFGSPGNGVASPGADTVAFVSAMTVPDVTPPWFTAGTPFVANTTLNTATIVLALAVSESATVWILALPADAPPPNSARDVIDGVYDLHTMSFSPGFHGSVVPVVRASGGAAPNYNASSENPIGGDAAFVEITSTTMRPDTSYAVYVAVSDLVSPANTADTVFVLTARTAACPSTPCEAGFFRTQSVYSCACAEGLNVVVALDVSLQEYEARTAYWLRVLARSIGVLPVQIHLVLSYHTKRFGVVEVEVVVIPLHPADTETFARVQLAVNNGGETPVRVVTDDVAVNVNATAPADGAAATTRIVPTSRGRPGGQTSPLTDDGRVPGHVLDRPTRSTRALFRWVVFFVGDEVNRTACAASHNCTSECLLDTGTWTPCVSPTQYHGLSEGEHNFRVRGVYNGSVDPAPERYTWTIRVLPEPRFVTKPAYAVNSTGAFFTFTSNRVGTTYEYSANENATGGGTRDPFPKFTKLGRDGPSGQVPVTALSLSAVRGWNTVLVRALADGEVSPGYVKHTWLLDTQAPSTRIESPTAGANNSRASKNRDVLFTLVGDDRDEAGFPSSGVAGFRVRLTNSSSVDALGNANVFYAATQGLFDYREYFHDLVGSVNNTSRLTLTLANLTGLANGLYVLSASAVDLAGNFVDPDDSAHKHSPFHHYFITLTDEIPGPAAVTRGDTFEDFMTPLFNDTACVNDTAVGCETQLTIKSQNPADAQYTVSYLITNISGGVLFYSDGVTRINEGDFVPTANASHGLRFLNTRGLNDEIFFEGFGFTAWPSSSFNSTGVVNLPVALRVSVTPVNDPPVLDRERRFALPDVYALDSETTNHGSFIYKIVAPGFHDVDGPFNETTGNVGIAVVGSDSSLGLGTWQWSSDDGDVWVSFPADLSPEKPLLLRATSTDRVRYLPSVEYEGVPLSDTAWSSSLTFRAWDGHSGRVSGERGWWVRDDDDSAVPPESTVPSTDPNAMYFDFNHPTLGATLDANNASSAFASSKGFNATWRWFDGASYTTWQTSGNEISMDTGTITVDVTGVARGLFTMGGGKTTLAAKEAAHATAVALDCGLTLANDVSLPSAPSNRKAPSHGVAFSVRSEDPYASLVFPPVFEEVSVNGTAAHALSNIHPPYTMQAWVRRDRSLLFQALFTGVDGGALLLEAPLDGVPGASGVVGVASPATMAALQSARRDFDNAMNNTALDDAASRISAARATVGFFRSKQGVPFTAPTKVWTHLSFVAVPHGSPYQAPHADIRLYVDGLFWGVASGEFGFPAPIGTIGGPGRASFALDEVRAWRIALDSFSLWSHYRQFVLGDEPGLALYLPLEEGCFSEQTHDRSAESFAQRRPPWIRNGTYAPFLGSGDDWSATTRGTTWERREQNSFACAEVSSIEPAVVSSKGGYEITLHGSGFRTSIDRILNFPSTDTGNTLTRNDTAGASAVCRFGVYGFSGGGVFETPAEISSDGSYVTCATPRTVFENGKRNGGAVVVAFCDRGSSCCSGSSRSPVTGFGPEFLPNFLAPENVDIAEMAEPNAHVVFRTAYVTSSSPPELIPGAVVTLVGWGFLDSHESASCEFVWGGKRETENATVTKVTSQARVVSSAVATCHFPEEAASINEGLDALELLHLHGRAIRVSLTLHGGSLRLESPTVTFSRVGSPTGRETGFTLAQNSVHRVWNASRDTGVVTGPPDGGLVVALDLQNSFNVSFRMNRAIQHFHAQCAFGTARVAGRNAHGSSFSHFVECVSPAAPRPGATVPLTARPRDAGLTRFFEIGLGDPLLRVGLQFQWVRPAEAGDDTLAYGQPVVATPTRGREVLLSTVGETGPVDGGWLLTVFGFGFVEGDACAFSWLDGNADSASGKTQPRQGVFVSSAMLKCEVPFLKQRVTRVRVMHSYDSSIRSGHKHLGSLEFTATAPVRELELEFVHHASRVLHENGGSLVAVAGGGITAGKDGGACRFRTTVVASRANAGVAPDTESGLECVSPALARRVSGTSNQNLDLVDFAVSASLVSGMLGSCTPVHGRKGLVIAPSTRGALAEATHSPAPPSGLANAVSFFWNLDKASAVPTELVHLLSASSVSLDVVTESNPLSKARASLHCVAAYEGSGVGGYSRLPNRASAGGAAFGSGNGNGTSFFAQCDAPPAPFEFRNGGFGTISVVIAIADSGGALSIAGGVALAHVEFEWASPPRVFAIAAARNEFVPSAATRFTSDKALSSLQARDGSFFTASGSGTAFLGFNDSRVYASSDDQDLGGAWWHLDGDVGRHASPAAVRGVDFRDPIQIRFAFQNNEAIASAGEDFGSGVSPGESSFQVSVAGFFVSSALVLVEPPSVLPQRTANDHVDVLIDVSNNGGVSWSETAAALRMKESVLS